MILNRDFSIVSNRGSELSQSSQSNLLVEEKKKALLRNALLQSGGNRTKAAELMGVSRRTLHRKLVRWPELDIQKEKLINKNGCSGWIRTSDQVINSHLLCH